MKEHRVRANDVAWIVWEIVSAVINHCLESPNGPKERRLAIIETGYGKTDGKADHVYRYGLKWVVIESTISKGNINFMVHRVDVF